MPDLRTHIDFSKRRGIAENIALVVNFIMGIEANDPEEQDLSQLTDSELTILELEVKKTLNDPLFPASTAMQLIEQEKQRRTKTK